jgi:UDP-N-acetylmuramoyl-tripeptide--D-alanyl-D-alanine ligase
MLGKTIAELAGYLRFKLEDPRFIEGFAVDSRKVKSGFVFFALAGDRVDGHLFLQEICDKGAIAAIVHSSFHDQIPGLLLIAVDDVLANLHFLASEFVRSQQARIIGITGSVGKTTTKEFCYTLLSRRYQVFKTPGNANSQIGLPLSLLNQVCLPEIVVLEMGTSAPGQIAKLVAIAPPEVAVMTKIAPAHLEFFDEGMLGIAKEKSSIFSHTQTKRAIINSQASCFEVVVRSGECIKDFYGLQKVGIHRDNHYTFTKEDSSVSIFDGVTTSPWLSLPFTEAHLVENFVASALVARYFGLSWQEIGDSACKLVGVEKRFEKIERSGITFINDCYNANPISMKAALSNLPKPLKGCRLIAVLGHMVELGTLSDQFHEEIGVFASEYIDVLFCLGEKCIPLRKGFEYSGKKVFWFQDIDDMKTELFNYINRGDVVLVKASNSVGLWRLLESDEINLCF